MRSYEFLEEKDWYDNVLYLSLGVSFLRILGSRFYKEGKGIEVLEISTEEKYKLIKDFFIKYKNSLKELDRILRE